MKGKLFPVAGAFSVVGSRTDVRAQATGEFRAPKAGEWFISGAYPEGYQAKNDLATPFYIAVLVRVEVVSVTRVIGLA